MFRRDLGRDILDGDRQRGDLVLPRLRQVGAADREQHLALEHEAIARRSGCPGRFASTVAQLAEELAAIALQLLHLRCQRHIQLLAEIGDLGVLLVSLRLRQIERAGDGGELRLQLDPPAA